MELLQESECEEEECVIVGLNSNRNKRNCICNYFEEVVPSYNENEFVMHFRIRRSLCEDLAEKYDSSNIFQKLRKDKRISAKKSVSIFFWFAGHEACAFRDLADRFNVSICSVSTIVHRVTKFVSGLSSTTIIWPNEAEKLRSTQFFRRKGAFSKAFGCIDGAHIQIDPISTCKDEYIDRKGITSLIVQGVCNEKKNS